MNEEYEYPNYYGDVNIKVKDIEEKQKILKDRVVLIGENLIETRDKTTNDIIILKKELKEIRQELKKVISFIETLSSEISNFARKEDLDILTKQAKMFQPLDFVRKSDLRIIKK